MLQRLARQIIVDESRPSTNPLQSIPQKKITRAIRAIQSNNFIFLNPKIVQKPITDFLHIQKELLVRPSFVLENRFQEEMVWPVFQSPCFQRVVYEHSILGLSLSNELHGICGGFVGVPGAEIMADVVFAIEV